MRTSSTTASWGVSPGRGRLPTLACDIQVLEFRARVTGPRDLVRDLRELFPRGSTLRSVAPQAYAASFDVRAEASASGACTIFQNGVPIGSAAHPDDVLASLEWAINNAAVEHLGSKYLLFHAGAVAHAHQGILLPAAAGSGKTTLVAGLVAAGFQYLSDEVGAIDPLTRRLVAFPKSLCVKRGSQVLLEELYPQLSHATSRRRFGGAPMKYLTPTGAAFASTRPPVRFVILPHYTEAAATALEPISRSAALERLMQQSFSLSSHGVPGMRAVVEILAGAECYALTIGNLQESVALVRGLAGHSGAPPYVRMQTVHQAVPAVSTAHRQPAPAPAPTPTPAPPPAPSPTALALSASRRADAQTLPSSTSFRRRLAWLSRGGLGLIAVGALVLAYATAMQADMLPSGPLTVPRPAALDRPRPPGLNTSLARVPVVSSGVGAGPGSPAVPAAQPVFGWARHLSVASIGLETEVVSASTQVNQQGELEWQTVPFVAAHYVNTAPIGGPGNAVITGHVATLSEGNVFRELDRIDYGDRVVVTSDYGEFTYVVDELKLVLPTEVSVMDPTPDARLTLITCGGQFDPHTRTFDLRLIVVAKLVDLA